MIKTCLHCTTEFPAYDTRAKFCSRSCAATHNNSHRTQSDNTKQKIRNSIHQKLLGRGIIPNTPRIPSKKRPVIDGIPINTCKDCGATWKNEKINFLCAACREKKRIEKYNKYFRTKHNVCKVCGVECVNQFCSQACSAHQQRLNTFAKIESGTYKSTNLTQWKYYVIHTRGHVCEICHQTEWMGQPIPLVLDHINGRSSENRLDNLRVVCGNCDMQLPTYKSKNKNSDRKARKGAW